MSNALEQFLNKNNDRAQKWIGIIEGMLSDEEAYSYAEDTLVGILEDAQKEGRITDAQIQAVENIRDKPSQNYGRRRY